MLDTILLFHKCGVDFKTRLSKAGNNTSWQYFCDVFILPWFRRNVEDNFLSDAYPDVSIGHMYIKAMTESNNKAGLPADFKIQNNRKRNESNVITSFMKEFFHRRLLTFKQLTTDIVKVWSYNDNTWSFLDCILNDNPGGRYDLKLNDHNRHLMAALIVTNFHQFLSQLSGARLVRIAYLTISKILHIKRELMAFCVKVGQEREEPDDHYYQRALYQGRGHAVRNQALVDPTFVMSELRDIISSGLNGLRTIRRLNKLNLPELDDGMDDGDIIGGLKLHLKNLEKERVKFMPELNNYVNTNCGLNATANNALIVGEFITLNFVLFLD